MTPNSVILSLKFFTNGIQLVKLSAKFLNLVFVNVNLPIIIVIAVPSKPILFIPFPITLTIPFITVDIPLNAVPNPLATFSEFLKEVTNSLTLSTKPLTALELDISNHIPSIFSFKAFVLASIEFIKRSCSVVAEPIEFIAVL